MGEGVRRSNDRLADRGRQAVSQLGQAVKRQREMQHLTLREVAEVTGVSYATLSRVERGGSMEAATFLALSGWLGQAPLFVPCDRCGGSGVLRSC